jgi:hypothetical protein
VKVKIAAFALLALVLLTGIWGRQAWRDIHPHSDLRSYAFAGYSLEFPAQWPSPEQDKKYTVVRSAPDLKEGSLDQFKWTLSIADEGVETSPEKVSQAMRSGYSEAPPATQLVRLANGVDAITWTVWEPRGEVSQEHRGYVFKAPNGHVYSAWQPMARDWRTKYRYDFLFRSVLASMKFKS